MALLQREGRVTYRGLKHVLGLDDAFLEEMREELSFKRVAIDEDGKGLVWTEEVHGTYTRACSPRNRYRHVPRAYTIHQGDRTGRTLAQRLCRKWCLGLSDRHP